MRSDDELLSHIRQQAGVRQQRRQRAIAGAATAAVVLLLGVGALAATGGDDGETVQADDAGPTTTEATTTTEEPTTTTSTSTTTSTTAAPPPPTTGPPAPTTTTEPPPTTTAPADLAPVSKTKVGDGITLTVDAIRDPARPGEVTLEIRIQAEHGSSPAGFVDWDATGASSSYQEDYDGFGAFEADVPLDCQEAIDAETGDGPPLEPDANAGPVDTTFTKTFSYGARTGEVRLSVHANTSWCTADGAFTGFDLVVPLA